MASYDENADLALLKIPVEDRKGQARLHLAQAPLNVGEGVSIFLRVLGRRRLADYEFELKGRDYYNPATELNLGKFILPADSLLFEKQGWVLPYRPEMIGKSVEDKDNSLIPAVDANFSSILSYNGESGSPIFARLRNGRYSFVGILASGWQIEHEIPTPGNPLGFASMAQTGTIFAHRNPITRLIENYSGIKK